MRVTLTYDDFRKQAVVGIQVYYYFDPKDKSFVARFNNAGVTCEYASDVAPPTWAVDFGLATLVTTFVEA
jgi:hypothetical protein